MNHVLRNGGRRERGGGVNLVWVSHWGYGKKIYLHMYVNMFASHSLISYLRTSHFISFQTTSGYFSFPLFISLFFPLDWPSKNKPSAHLSQQPLNANRHQLWAFNQAGCLCFFFFFFFTCEWSAGDYSSNDNSTYGGWINLPEHWDHKSNLRMIILLPDEELIQNIMLWSGKRRCVCGSVWGEACLPIVDKTGKLGQFSFI